MAVTNHQKYMNKALALAEKGACYTKPNPKVGCVIVSADGKQVAKGYHKYYGGNHAEVEAIQHAQRKGLTYSIVLFMSRLNHVRI